NADGREISETGQGVTSKHACSRAERVICQVHVVMKFDIRQELIGHKLCTEQVGDLGNIRSFYAHEERHRCEDPGKDLLERELRLHRNEFEDRIEKFDEGQKGDQHGRDIQYQPHAVGGSRRSSIDGVDVLLLNHGPCSTACLGHLRFRQEQLRQVK